MRLHKSPQTREMASTVARHMQWKGVWPSCTEADIFEAYADHADGYQKLCIAWYDALADLKERNHYRSLDEITDPQEGAVYFIRVNGDRPCYRWKNGKWVFQGETPDSVLY